MRLFRRAGYLVAVALLAACGGQPTEPPLPTVALTATNPPPTADLLASPAATNTPAATPTQARQAAVPSDGNLQAVVVSQVNPYNDLDPNIPFIPAGDLYALNAGDSDIRRLTLDPALDYDPVWEPNGSRVYFVSERDGIPYIYVVNADNTNPVQRVSAFPSGDERHPTVSPTGQIAFTTNRGGVDAIYKMNFDGRAVQQLTFNPTSDYDPTWSPDDTWIAFVSERDGNPELYIMDTDGGQVNRLTNDPGVDHQPVFSPDGKRIAFISDRDGSPQVFILTLPEGLPPTPTQNFSGEIVTPIPTLPPIYTGSVPPLRLDFNRPMPTYRVTGSDDPKSSPGWYTTAAGTTGVIYTQQIITPQGVFFETIAASGDGSFPRAVSPLSYSMGNGAARPIAVR